MLLYFKNDSDTLKKYQISVEFIQMSMGFSVVNGGCQFALLYMEAKSGKKPLLPFIVMCFAGLAEYVPLLDVVDTDAPETFC